MTSRSSSSGVQSWPRRRAPSNEAMEPAGLILAALRGRSWAGGSSPRRWAAASEAARFSRRDPPRSQRGTLVG